MLLRRLAPALLLAACASDASLYEGETVKSDDEKYDSSAHALFVDFEWDGELTTDTVWNKERAVENHLLYTMGQLNGFNSVGRLDRLVLSNVRATTDSGRTRISYHARMPVAWGKKNDVPSTFELILPGDDGALDRFAEKYGRSCVDFGAHDVDAGSMWYYFRPLRSGCRFADGDVRRFTASVSPSAIQTTGKFPEYDKVWEDGVLEVVAVFGKYEDGATSASDAGIAAYNQFIRAMQAELASRRPTTIPATIPNAPGIGTPDIELSATLPDGKRIHVVALLVDNVRTAGPGFDARYEALSTRADLIVYNGHAGLGANVRALAAKGSWVTGQYVIAFLNGCDTYAYVDGALARAHAAVNPDDPEGTKHVDLIANAMPSFFSDMAGATMTLFRGLLAYDAPMTYEQIFRGVSASQVVLVTGEHDNVFTPGGGGAPQAWAGLREAGSLSRGQTAAFATPTLAAGTYLFEMTGTRDADLYVRIGAAPTTSRFDCRPYKSGSNESCEVTLPQPAPIHILVRGDSLLGASTFELIGRPLR
jgi:hypothetical protein